MTEKHYLPLAREDGDCEIQQRRHHEGRPGCSIRRLVTLLASIFCVGILVTFARNTKVTNAVDFRTGLNAASWTLNASSGKNDLDPVTCYPDEGSQKTPVSLLFGIMTHTQAKEKRDLLRWAYSQWHPYLNPTDFAKILFVMCRPTDDETRLELEQESQKYNDIHFVQGEESGVKADQGKVWWFLDSITNIAKSEGHDAVFKVDTDSFVNLPKVFDDFRKLKSEPYIYWGGVFPREHKGGGQSNKRFKWMLGEIYGLSVDLLSLLTGPEYPYARDNYLGQEDIKVGEWISWLPEPIFSKVKIIDRFRNFTDAPSYDHFASKFAGPDTAPVTHTKEEWFDVQSPACGRPSGGDLRSQTYVIHQLKDSEEFQQTANWFIHGITMAWKGS